ncbi:MAG: ABC transporter ATP-binding protein, partial [Clostridia bacterium]|nr:ABC transporter ATP-binding protein [Clostridia bacterium]
QRIALARALLRDAPVLLLDEATSALDVATERRVLRSIRERAPQKTILLTTHRPTVLGMCSRVYRVTDTRIVELSAEESSALAMDF